MKHCKLMHREHWSKTCSRRWWQLVLWSARGFVITAVFCYLAHPTSRLVLFVVIIRHCARESATAAERPFCSSRGMRR